MTESRRTNPTAGIGSRVASGGSEQGSLPVRNREASGELAGRSSQSLRRLDPFTMMDRLGGEMERLFESFGFGRLMPNLVRPLGATGLMPGSSRGVGRPDLPGFWSPQIEVYEEGGELVVCADLPGLRKEDVRLEVEDDTLILQGERRHQHEERNEGVYRTERSYGSFYRAIPLPDGTDPERVRASFRDGVLEVRTPMSEAPRRGRRITIEGEGGSARSGEPTEAPGASGTHLTQAGPPPLASAGETGTATGIGGGTTGPASSRRGATGAGASEPKGAKTGAGRSGTPGKGGTGETEGLP